MTTLEFYSKGCKVFYWSIRAPEISPDLRKTLEKCREHGDFRFITERDQGYEKAKSN